MNRSSKKKILLLTHAGVIAALYTVLTLLAGVFGLSGGVIQLRLSEALCILPLFTPAAIPGLTIGCLISNLITGCIWQDVIFGTIATLIGALGARLLKKIPFISPLPTVAANTLIVPLVLAYGYGFEGGIGYFMLTVGIGEILSAYVLGILLFFSLRKRACQIFKI